MRTIPYQVAKWIVLEKIHPVTAWRHYCNISKESLSVIANLSIVEIEKIEKSNLHLKENFLKKLSEAFGVYTEALNIRYLTL